MAQASVARPASAPSASSLIGLDSLNFFIAGMQAAFGPYVAVYLADKKWTQEDIGFVLSAGSFAALLSQLPGGELVDTVRSKRALIALGVFMMAVSALIIAFWPTWPMVLIALVMQGMTGGIIGVAVAAISLGLVGLSKLPERLGRNQRFASIGGLIVAGLMGVIANYLQYQAIFATVAILSLPAFAVLLQIRSADVHFGRSCGAAEHETLSQSERADRSLLWKRPGLVVFAAILFLFQLANASILPLAGADLVYQDVQHTSLIVSALIVVPQLVVALTAPEVGRYATIWGRRPLLLIGLASLPIRAFLFALDPYPLLLIAVQLLDGVSGAILGVLTAQIIADITDGSGRFNLAQGFVGTSSGIGAAISISLFGLVATHFGHTTAFLGIAAVALLAFLLAMLLMPETKPPPEAINA